MKKLLYFAAAILLVLLLATIQTCSFYKRNFVLNKIALTDTIRHFTNRLGTQTASINTLRLSNKDLRDVIIKKDKNLSELSKEFASVKSIVKYKTIIVIDSIPVTYKDTVPAIFERSGEIKKDWYSFSYKSNQKGLLIDSLQLWNQSTIITGFKRNWLLGKQALTTDITNSNPYLKVNEIKAAEVTIPSPWYKKWYVWLAAGCAGGIFIAR